VIAAYGHNKLGPINTHDLEPIVQAQPMQAVIVTSSSSRIVLTTPIAGPAQLYGSHGARGGGGDGG